MTVYSVPGALVGYSTEYSDHSNELSNRSYTTGFGSGKAGTDGIFRAAWVVPATVPAGRATVHLIASEGPIQPEASFTIVIEQETCP